MMIKHNNLTVALLTLLLTSCGLNPPEWLHGQWERNDYTSKGSRWKIDENGIYFGTYEIQSTFLINRTEIFESNRYIIRADHMLENEPHFTIFKRVGANEFIGYDSSSSIQSQKIRFLKIQ